MSVNTPEGCRQEALRLIDMSNDAARRGLSRKARDHYERAVTLLLIAKKLEAETEPPVTVQ